MAPVVFGDTLRQTNADVDVGHLSWIVGLPHEACSIPVAAVDCCCLFAEGSGGPGASGWKFASRADARGDSARSGTCARAGGARAGTSASASGASALSGAARRRSLHCH